MFSLVGLDPAKAPSRNPEVCENHVRILVRYIGFKAGLEAAAGSRDDYDLSTPTSEILGTFLEDRLFFRKQDHLDTSVFHDLRRMLALVEGATGYPMTSKTNEMKAIMFFIKAVVKDINDVKLAEGVVDEPAAPSRSPSRPSM